MKNRRSLLLLLAVTFVTSGLLAASALADELLGVLTKVDVEGKKVTVVAKDSDKEIQVKVTEDTVYVTPKGAAKIDLEKVAKNVAKAQEKGRKGINVAVTHEKAVASKITVAAKKQEAPKTDK